MKLNLSNLNDYKNYIEKFEQVEKLAKRFRSSPGEIIELFFSIGLEALKQTDNLLKKEFAEKLNVFFNEESTQKIINDFIERLNKK